MRASQGSLCQSRLHSRIDGTLDAAHEPRKLRLKLRDAGGLGSERLPLLAQAGLLLVDAVYGGSQERLAVDRVKAVCFGLVHRFPEARC